MKIALIGQKGFPAASGGVERHVQELATRLVRYGHEILVYIRPWYSQPDAAPPVAGITLIPTQSFHTKHLDTITYTLFATLHALFVRADVIHFHGVGPALMSWLPRLVAPRTRVVCTLHSLDRKHEKWGLFARLMLKCGEYAACRFPHETIVVSRTLEQYARDVYDRKAVYIPNGASTIGSALPEAETLSPFGLKPKEYLLVVSRLIPHKGIHTLIHAYQQLAHPEKKLVIVGDGYYTDSYVRTLKNLAAANPNIIFTGTQSGETLRALYTYAYALIHPSLNEGLSLAVLEAMGAGLPVLLSNIPEHRELGISEAFLYTAERTDALTRSLERLLAETPSLLSATGRTNEYIARTRYHWDMITQETVTLYEKLTAAARNKQLASVRI